MSVTSVAKAAFASVKAHKPEIMIGAGLIAGAGAIVVAVKETPACLEAFEKEEIIVPAYDEDGNRIENQMEKVPLDWKTKAVIYAKSYFLAALLEILSVILIAGGAKIRLDTCMRWMTLYGLTQADLDDLKNVISKHPESWKKKFNEKMAEVHMDETTADDVPAERMSSTEVPMPLPLFWDDQAKVYYRLSEEELRDALSELIHMIYSDPFDQVSMNDWMRIIGHEEVSGGDYKLLTREDEGPSGALKYNQIGVKESPTGEPARMMTLSWPYHVDTRMIYGDI